MGGYIGNFLKIKNEWHGIFVLFILMELARFCQAKFFGIGQMISGRPLNDAEYIVESRHLYFWVTLCLFFVVKLVDRFIEK